MTRRVLLAFAVVLIGCGSDGSSSGIGYWRGGGPVGGEPGQPSGGTPGTPSGNQNNAGGSGGSGGSPGAPAPTGTSPGGGGVDASAPPPAPMSYAVTLDKSTATIDLAAQQTYQVSVAPTGYRGGVALSVTGLPTGVTGSFDKSSLTLDGATTATATLTLKTATDTAPGDVAFSVVAAGGANNMTASSMLTVSSVLTITIPSGVDNNGGSTGNPVMDAFGPYPIAITAPANLSSANPVTIHFYNGDSVPHEIHASAPGAGFPHGSGEFGPGQTEPTKRAVNMKGTYDFYLHDQGGPSTVGRIVIQ
jgi:hypothetical protein